jgi:hypothetical protein
MRQFDRSKKRDWYDCANLGIAIFGLIGLCYYAHWAKVQAVANGNAVNAAKDSADAAKAANTLVAANAHTQLRAYVNLGDSRGIPIKSVNRIATDKFVIQINFTNAGQTPALNFAVSLVNEAKHLTFRERWYDETSHGILSQALSSPQLTINSNATVSIPLEYDAPLNRNSLVFGVFEYCDVFGTYWCSTFFSRPSQEWPFAFKQFGSTQCGIPEYGQPPSGEFLIGKKTRWRPLLRCEQPDEIRADQGGKVKK